MPDNENNKPKLKPGEIVGIIIAVVLMLLVASCTLMGTGSSKSSNWDNLTKDEKQWYNDNYGNGQYDKYQDAIRDYQNKH